MSGRKKRWVLGMPFTGPKNWWGMSRLRLVLSDDVIASETPCIRQLLDVYEYYGASVWP